MANSSTPITGNESLWGAAKNTLTPNEIALINDSPLLVSELNAYQSAIDSGKALPITLDEQGPISLQTVNSSSGLQIELGQGLMTGSDGTFIGSLSYEIGHFVNFENDQNLYNGIANLNPNDPNYATMAGVVGTITEAESEANNYAVQQEILNATSQGQPGQTPVSIDLNGNGNSGGLIQSTLDNAYASDKANGVDAQQDLSALTYAAAGVAGTVPYAIENGSPINFYDYYSENASDVHNYFFPPSSGSSDTGVQGAQSVDATNVAINFESGSLQSSTIQFSSGTSEILSFSNSQVSSATYTDTSGNVVSTISYVHNTDGSYSATMTDGAGTVVSTQNFSSDGSEVETVTNVDTPVDINASGVTLTTNGDVIDVNGQNYDSTILGGDHTINAEAGDSFALSGVGYTVNLASSGNSTVSFSANSGGTVSGTGNLIQLNGTGDVVTASNESVTATTGQGGSAEIIGGGNTISIGNADSGSTFTLEGTGTNADTLNLAGATDVTALLGTATTMVDLGINNSLTVSSVNGGGTVVGNTGDNVTVSGSNVTLDATAGQYSLTGNGDTANVSNSSISVASGDEATVSGSGDSVTGGTGSTIAVDGQSDSISATDSTIDLGVNSQATISGTGDSIAAASGDVIDLSNATITLTAGSSVTIDGSNDTIIGAAGDTITIAGQGDSVDASSATITMDGSSSLNLNGSDNIISEASGDSLGAYGGNNTIDTTTGALTVVGNTGGAFDVINASDDQFGGTTANGQGTGIFLNANSQANVTGSSNSVGEDKGDSLGVYGGGNTIDTTGGALTVVGNTGGAFDTINASGDQFGGTTANGQGTGIFLNANSQANVTGSSDSVGEDTGDSLGVYGGGNTIDTTGGALTVVGNTGGTFDTINASGDQFGGTTANGQDTGIFLNASSQANVSGSNDGVGANAGGSQMEVSGTGDTLNLTNDAVTFEQGSGGVVNGNDNSIAATGSTVGITMVGNGDTVSSTVVDNGFAVTGSGETFNTTGDGITFEQGSGGVVNGNDNAVAAANGSAAGSVHVTLVGNGDTVSSASADDGFAVTGSSETFNTTGDGITFEQGSGGVVNGNDNAVAAANGSAAGSVDVTLVGNGDTVSSTSVDDGFAVTGSSETFDTTGDGITFEQGSGGVVNGNDNAVAAANGSAAGSVDVTLVGNGDTVSSTSVDDGFAVTGSSETFDTTGDGITFEQGSGGLVSGNDNSVAAAGGDIGVTLTGNGDRVDSSVVDNGFAVTGSDDTFDITGDGVTVEANSRITVQGNSNAIAEESNDHANIDGNDNSTNGGDDTSITADGSGDTLNGQAVANDSTGDIGSSGSFSDSSDDSGGDSGGDGGYGYYGYGGFAGSQSVINAALGSNISSIALHDLGITSQAGVAAAEAGLLQAQEMADATPTAGTGSVVDSGKKWAGDVITWSLASNMGSQYDADVQQAFATWAAASGITFEEVSGSSKADIQIGFGDLNTATSGLVGYTDFHAKNGQISSAAIQLEDPAQEALVIGANGQETYSGTDATLEQVLLHEIGHALGLADDSDQDSIMYYELTSNNQTLDSTDIAGIQSLYGGAGNAAQLTAPAGSSGSQAGVDHQLSQLVASMASFNTSVAGNTSLAYDDAHHHMILAASAH